MDRIFQWVWDRHGPRYSWAICALIYPPGLLVYLSYSLIILAFEGSGRFIDAAVVTAVAMVVRVYLLVLPGSKELRLIEMWAAGQEIDPMTALGATFAYTRRVTIRMLATDVVWAALLGVVVGGIAGATGWRLVQYGIVGAAYGAAVGVINMHSFVEGALRPARAAIAGDTGIGDSLPRSRPTFAAWSKMSTLAVAFAFATAGAILASLIDRAREDPVVSVMIGCALTLISGQLTVMTTSPFLQPIRDLAKEQNVLPSVTTANACRWFRTTTWARWRRRSTACRRDWPSGNDFRRRLAPTSIQPLRRGYLHRVMTCSPVSAAR